MLNKWSLVVIMILLFPMVNKAEKKEKIIGFQGGIYVTDFGGTNAKTGMQYTLEFGTYLSERLVLITHFNFGEGQFQDYSYTNISDGDFNIHVIDNHFALMAGYNQKLSNSFDMQFFAGLGLLNRLYAFDYMYYYPAGTAVSSKIQSEIIPTIPMKLALNYKITDCWDFSLVSAVYFNVEHYFSGWHIGPQLNYRF